MSKARKVLKYSAAGAVTSLYLLAIRRALTVGSTEELPAMNPKAVVATAGTLTILTWAMALL